MLPFSPQTAILVCCSSSFGARQCGLRRVNRPRPIMEKTPRIRDTRLRPIAEKVLAGERLDVRDGISLYRSPDLLAVGWLANYVREQKHGATCFFNVNRHINPTNVCVAHCRLCAF